MYKRQHLSDDLNRVGRGVLRKLGPNDRIVKPLNYLYENNLKHDALAKLVSYALQFDNLDDPEQIRMTEMIKDQGIAEFIKEHTELPEPLVRNIIEEQKS